MFIPAGLLAQTRGADDVDIPDRWADTYTPEEIAAIERALWAANLTLEDLNFRKDYTKGYGCFPIVREWMASPIELAPGMDAMVAEISDPKTNHTEPFNTLNAAIDYFPGGTPLQQMGNQVYHPVPVQYEFVVTDIEDVELMLRLMLDFDLEWPWAHEHDKILRQNAPLQMAWHDVFESPFSEEHQEDIEDILESESDEYLYELMETTDINVLMRNYFRSCPDPRGWLDEIPLTAFPTFRKEIIETEFGRIGIGSRRDDVWEGDFVILIDPAGDDIYKDCRIGAAYGTEGNRFGYFVDLEGDDTYDCRNTNITLGAAILGVAAFYDLGGGNDRYYAGSCTLGATMCGIATFYDDGGSDIYEGKVYTQGAAGFGIGVMVDDSVMEAPDVPTDEETPDPIDIAVFDNDTYKAWANSQAFARTLGFAVCSNKRGNEIYEAGGVYLHAPLFADRYQSFSQGFAIGERGIDYAGGIALILDYDGNDRYLGDIYNQGVGYWYSAGLVYDVAGNDNYEMTQYGQGSGIHLAIGGLIDVAGNDCYTMHNGLGTGGSHDYAASVLHDRGGNDQYFGNTSCNGGSLTNSAVIFIDRAGNDTYAGRRNSGVNFARPARGFNSIGILIDLEGEDDYLGIMDNGMLWTHTDVGVGWDIMPPPPPEPVEGEEPAPVEEPEEPDVEMPEIIDYEGELTQEVFDELWGISVRWEVGDNRYIVPKARQKLIDYGPEILPMLSVKFDNMNSGLAIRAFDQILRALIEVDRDGVIEILRENITSDNEISIRTAFAEISTLNAVELEDEVAEFLLHDDPAMVRRAIGVLGTLGSHVADDILIANLREWDDEALIKVSVETLFRLEVGTWGDFEPLLEHPYISVRETLIRLLSANSEKFDGAVREAILLETGFSPAAYYPPPISVRQFRSLLKYCTRVNFVPDPTLGMAMNALLGDEDWGVRADTIRVIRHWQDLIDRAEDDEEIPDGFRNRDVIDLVNELMDAIDRSLEDEDDPFVLFVASEE